MGSKNNHTQIGSWIVAAGTVASAINASINANTGDDDEGLNLIGNTLQATGNGVVASDSGSILSASGNIIQAAGNSTIIYSILADLERRDDLNLVIKGNLLQALGGLIGFSETYEAAPTLAYAYKLNGELLEVIGNSIQAIAAGRELEGIDARYFSALGSWIQALGAIIVALTITKQERRLA
ncbi:DUF6944 family repetitive protein [Halobacillus trueperi]|uniref:Uncharacterized protein n=1 Tax=Halobacillus trueperi TaxID=156205 RepID=A0A3E0J627_9BACI|nr:hypothetical protein [Halobacillus trueperi]REJ08438.1 hypothetical protein DYE48_13645 [Halobacillus trueperi]